MLNTVPILDALWVIYMMSSYFHPILYFDHRNSGVHSGGESQPQRLAIC